MNKKEFKTKVFGIIVDYVHDDLFKTDNCVKSIDEFWNWINQNYISKDEILGLEGFKEEVIDENTTKQAIDIEKINEGNVSAREILEDIGKSFNQRNSLRREIKQQIIDYKNK